MAAALDLVHGDALEPDRARLLTEVWLETVFGQALRTPARYLRALTHSSRAAANYERLEFLGDRVLGLTMAEWLFERFPEEAEGTLSRHFNALVSGAVCAEVAQQLGVSEHLRLGKQARDDGVAASTNVLGDVMEALIGAFYLDEGLEAARAFIRRIWGDRIDVQWHAPKHPKAALQEWAAAHNRKPPVYTVLHRSGPDHAPRFVVQVALGGMAGAEGEGRSKQEAEIAAAAALLARLETP